jgi:hypothetical protein
MGGGVVYVMGLGPTTSILIYISQTQIRVGVSNLTATHMHYTSFLIIIARANAMIPEKGGGGVDGGDGARGVVDSGASEGEGMLGSGGRSDDAGEGPTTTAQVRGRRRGW